MKKKENIIEKITTEMRNGNSIGMINVIQSMPDIQLRDRYGRTLLINAVFYNCLNIAETFIKLGGDVNASDNVGYTALHAATQEGNIDAIRLLLKNGANVNQKNNFGNTPLWVAMPSHPKELFLVLLLHGADPNIKNNYGISAMDCMSAYPEIIELFKKYDSQI